MGSQKEDRTSTPTDLARANVQSELFGLGQDELGAAAGPSLELREPLYKGRKCGQCMLQHPHFNGLGRESESPYNKRESACIICPATAPWKRWPSIYIG